MPQCAVATCRNSHRRTRGRRIRYHRFPQLPEVRSRWVRACGRVPLSNGNAPFNIQTARICSLHFTNESYEKDVEHMVLGLPARSRLRRGAVPTVCVPVSVQPVTKMLVEDAKRSLLKVPPPQPKQIRNDRKTPTSTDVPVKEGNVGENVVVVQGGKKKSLASGARFNKAAVTSSVNAIAADGEQKMAGIDVLLALGLKPAPRLNKMHAMDTSGIGKGGAGSEKVAKKGEKIVQGKREKTTPVNSKSLVKDQRKNAGLGVVNAESTATALPVSHQRNHRDRKNHQNHTNHRRNGGEPPADLARNYGVKKEPTSEPETDLEHERDALPELRKRSGSNNTTKNLKSERLSKKRRSTDEIMQNSNGSSKRACLEQREELISSIVGGDKITTEELAVRAEQLRAELQALDQLARDKEKEWNEILSMRKLKEEAYLRIERRRQVVGFMEGNSCQLNESSSVLPTGSISLEQEWDNAKEKSNSTEATLSDKSTSRPQVTSKQNENGQKESSDGGQNSENRQIGEGRQGPMVDVRTIIADYRLRHPETVPRRSRRMRNSVNVGLGAGGAVVETTQIGVDSRPSSTDSCKSSSNPTDPSNSMSFKDVLVQFAKLSQQQGEAVKTPQNYPDVTLHPVLPTPAPPQAATVQQSGSLLHGILTKTQTVRPTTFSPTLARLLTAPERERCNPVATSTPQQQTATTQHLLQAYQGTNPVSISDLLSSSKARTEITITPVVNTPIVQSHSNSLIHVEDVEEETTVIEERSRSTNARDESPPRCQGCQDRAAQFVCAGCGNQWYCSRECQVSAWDEHSEVCSGCESKNKKERKKRKKKKMNRK
ncbi:uncharacterized protein LOC124183344 isoform X4 [Neodiprion fabricii]|uniref:uncharacterized protein LOC124183344 isoform X4 n=1 Tax=Neodiprion fabricii TaxID=2872261 RepID=UPI001ED95A4F|nr:uncharacterized protein LOC124183344 isoform X4 [Neodiprion fabricii]